MRGRSSAFLQDRLVTLPFFPLLGPGPWPTLLVHAEWRAYCRRTDFSFGHEILFREVCHVIDWWWLEMGSTPSPFGIMRGCFCTLRLRG